MEPVPAVRKVRRTVRTAVVLLLSQALLCAVIGVVTMRNRDTAAPARAVDRQQLAAPPLDAPPPPARAGMSPSPSASTTTRPRSAPRTTTTEPPPAEPSTVTTFAPPVLPSPDPTGTTGAVIVPPSPPTFGTNSPHGVQSPPVSALPTVRVGDSCDTEGSYARTQIMVLVVCHRTTRHGLRWKIA